MNSEAYEKAYQAVRKASHQFAEIQRAYRAREIGDADFLAARKLYQIAETDFDSAYAAEQENQS